MFSRRARMFYSGIFLVFIFVIAFFLRAQETLSGNFLFLLDSGRDMLAVRDIVFEHKPTLIGPYTSLGGVFQGPLYYYLLSIPTAIFQGNPWGNILLMLILSLLNLAVVSYFMNRFFGLVPAAITFILFAFSPEAIAAATYFWNPHPMWIILSLYIFILFGAIKQIKWMQIALWPVVTISFHFEMAFGFFLFISTLIYLLLIYRKLFFKPKNIWVGFFISLIFFAPQIVFDIRHNFLMSTSVLQVVQGESKGLITSSEQEGAFSILANNFNVLWKNLISSFPYDEHFIKLPYAILILTFTTFIFSSVKRLFSKDEKIFIQAVFITIIIISIFSIIYPFPLRYWYLTGFQSFYLILIGIILSKLFKFRIGKFLLLAILLVFLAYSITRMNNLYFNPPDNGGVAKIQGKLDAIDHIYKDADNEEFGVLVFTPPVLTDAYDYLFWWYGSEKYGYIPHSEKEGAVYLLIEPDPGQPWSYKGWLETVVKDGEIVKSETLSSGFIIEKRNFK